MLGRLVLLAGVLAGIVSVNAQDCSATNPCATGCCSKDGWCGVGEDYCGANCVANCDFQSECDANRPCANDACCSKAGFCGLGPDYCAPDSCVSGCDNRAYCDPGGYGEYAEHSKCPLNVCCSKWGYCGMTSEFCGDTKVKRPSADYNDFTPLRRIVGYYEGWSHERPCNSFFPEQITPGIYTHLNYAFATIDPTSFEVKLASTTEEDLIRRLARLKTQDADLKVYVALGGWAYNDPGPTQTTFSDLARSEDAQKKFFRSLISFLSTYNLDGVDIDWEYPGPHEIVDRGGREEDFDNFPIFLRRLKQALKSAGGRDGVTITLPASYWFLQHFNIVQLEKHVDFFNIMSYDLHGAWDKGNKWLGPYLNAHTNLTEISDALDLLWRNKIPSNKVVLGTAFYGRAFAATSTSCLEPGCTFESAATMGDCSRENGILLNSEIVDILDAQGVKPTLDKKAGVKIATWDNQWVAYDDEETLELKAQFSLGLGLGGVMVWAVSHDTPTQRFSNAFFRRAANRNGLTSTTESNSTRYVETRKLIDQCKWTNCGKTCPAGYRPALRTDKNAADNEVMLDKTACDGDHHTLCCPEKAMATCGWYMHTNSFCDYSCPQDFVEVGSNHHGCHSGYQAACCRVTSNPIHSWTLSSMGMWGKCQWAGDRSGDRRDPDCSDHTCPSARARDPVLTSNAGSGAVSCKDDSERRYCCADAQNEGGEGNQWLNGTWEDHLGRFMQDNSTRERCWSDCEDDTYRLAMEQTGVCENKPGAKAYCAPNGYYDIEWKERANVTDVKEALDIFFNNPQCPNDQSGGLEARDQTVSGAQMQVGIMLAAILGAPLYEKTMVADYQDLWNEISDEHGFQYLKFPEFRESLEEWFGNIYRDISKIIDTIKCRFEDLNDLASPNPVLSCEDEDPCEDDDADCESEEWDDPCPEAEASLDKRGVERTYCIRSRGTTLRSRRYRSTGQVPSTDFLRRRVIVLRHRRDCSNTNVRQVSMPTGNQVDGQLIHVEHPTEMNTEPTLLSDLSLGQLDEDHQNAFTPIPAGFVSDAWMNGQVMNPRDYALPVGGVEGDPSARIPSQRIYQAYGSVTYDVNFWMLEWYLNFLKNRVWRWRVWTNGPLAESSMTTHVNNVDDPRQALSRIRSVIGVFQYLNLDGVRATLRDQYQLTFRERRLVNLAWNAAHPDEQFDIRTPTRLWFQNHYRRMEESAQEFLDRWLREMERIWESRTGQRAARVRDDIQSLLDEVAGGVLHINTDDFWDVETD